MGTLTLNELKSEIRTALGGRTDQDSRLTRALNLAQKRIARVRLWDELFVKLSEPLTITGTPSTDKIYNLPTDIRDLLTVRIIDPNNSSRARRLQKLVYTKFDKQIPEPERYIIGIPSIYTRFKNTIELWKIPDAAYRIELRYSKWPAEFSDSNGSAVSELENKDDLLIYAALVYINKSLGRPEAADNWERDYLRSLRDAVAEESDEPDLDLVNSNDISIGPVDYWKDPFTRGL